MLPCVLHRRRALWRPPQVVWFWGDTHDPLVVYVESWMFSALFGMTGEMLCDFQNTYIVYVEVASDTVGGVLLFIYGQPFSQTLAMFLIVSVSVCLRIRRNRARAWARGLQNPVWASRYFI